MKLEDLLHSSTAKIRTVYEHVDYLLQKRKVIDDSLTLSIKEKDSLLLQKQKDVDSILFSLAESSDHYKNYDSTTIEADKEIIELYTQAKFESTKLAMKSAYDDAVQRVGIAEACHYRRLGFVYELKENQLILHATIRREKRNVYEESLEEMLSEVFALHNRAPKIVQNSESIMIYSLDIPDPTLLITSLQEATNPILKDIKVFVLPFDYNKKFKSSTTFVDEGKRYICQKDTKNRFGKDRTYFCQQAKNVERIILTTGEMAVEEESAIRYLLSKNIQGGLLTIDEAIATAKQYEQKLFFHDLSNYGSTLVKAIENGELLLHDTKVSENALTDYLIFTSASNFVHQFEKNEGNELLRSGIESIKYSDVSTIFHIGLGGIQRLIARGALTRASKDSIALSSLVHFVDHYRYAGRWIACSS